jgi:hypothetical protein
MRGGGLLRRTDDALSAGLFPLLNRALVRVQVDIASIPDRNRLHVNALLLAPLDVAYHVDPRSDIDFMALHRLEHVLDVHVCGFARARRRQMVVLQPQRRAFEKIFIDTA